MKPTRFTDKTMRLCFEDAADETVMKIATLAHELDEKPAPANVDEAIASINKAFEDVTEETVLEAIRLIYPRIVVNNHIANTLSETLIDPIKTPMGSVIHGGSYRGAKQQNHDALAVVAGEERVVIFDGLGSDPLSLSAVLEMAKLTIESKNNGGIINR